MKHNIHPHFSRESHRHRFRPIEIEKGLAGILLNSAGLAFYSSNISNAFIPYRVGLAASLPAVSRQLQRVLVVSTV
jgi:hypothetical protein